MPKLCRNCEDVTCEHYGDIHLSGAWCCKEKTEAPERTTSLGSAEFTCYAKMLDDEMKSHLGEYAEGLRRGWGREVMLILESKMQAISRIIEITNSMRA